MLALIFFLTVCLAIVEVFRRYVLGESFFWQQDVVVYSFLVAVFLHLGITERLGAHLKVDLFSEALIRRSRLAGGVFLGLGDLASLLYVGMFVYWGIRLVEFGKRVGRLVTSQIMPVWPFYAVMVAGFALLWLWLVFRFYRDVLAARGLREFGDELLPDPGGERKIQELM
ncbi:MAG TPA: TRAP transporter small permease [Bacillota bacterium]